VIDSCTGEACTECRGEPVNCDDGIKCTVDACDPASGKCSHTADDSVCDDGLFCNGMETCVPELGGCGVYTCPACDCVESECGTIECDEVADKCVEVPFPACEVTIEARACDDGDPCTGFDQRMYDFCNDVPCGECKGEPVSCCGDGVCDSTEQFNVDSYCPEDCCGDNECSFVEGDSPLAYCALDCCGDASCEAVENFDLFSYCAEDCCGDEICSDLERTELYCVADCCGDDVCDPIEEVSSEANCPADCCGNGVCSPVEDLYNDFYCAADCCGDQYCSIIELTDPATYCADDCCGDGQCVDIEENVIYCAADCCGDGFCAELEYEVCFGDCCAQGGEPCVQDSDCCNGSCGFKVCDFD